MKHHKDERTLVLIKPDGVQRALIGEVIQRFERIGLKIIGLKFLVPTQDFVRQHCTLEPTWKKTVGEKKIKSLQERGETLPSNDPLVMGDAILANLVRYLSSGPVVAIALQGAHAVAIVRKLVGSTEPLSSDVGTIRGDYVLDSYSLSEADKRAVRNVVHASGTVKEAEDELAHWFDKEEIVSYKTIQEAILYDVNLDGIME